MAAGAAGQCSAAARALEGLVAQGILPLMVPTLLPTALRSAQSPSPSQRGWEGNRSAQSDWNKELWDLTVPLFSLSHFLSLEHLPALFLVTATICLESTEGPFPREERIKSAQPPQQETRLPFWCTKDIRKSLYISSRSKPAHLLLTPEC